MHACTFETNPSPRSQSPNKHCMRKLEIFNSYFLPTLLYAPIRAAPTNALCGKCKLKLKFKYSNLFFIKNKVYTHTRIDTQTHARARRQSRAEAFCGMKGNQRPEMLVRRCSSEVLKEPLTSSKASLDFKGVPPLIPLTPNAL